MLEIGCIVRCHRRYTFGIYTNVYVMLSLFVCTFPLYISIGFAAVCFFYVDKKLGICTIVAYILIILLYLVEFLIVHVCVRRFYANIHISVSETSVNIFCKVFILAAELCERIIYGMLLICSYMCIFMHNFCGQNRIHDC